MPTDDEVILATAAQTLYSRYSCDKSVLCTVPYLKTILLVMLVTVYLVQQQESSGAIAFSLGWCLHRLQSMMGQHAQQYDEKKLTHTQ